VWAHCEHGSDWVSKLVIHGASVEALLVILEVLERLYVSGITILYIIWLSVCVYCELKWHLYQQKMKLLTHNMLTSKCLKGVNVGYPLGIVVSMCYVVRNCHTVWKIRWEYFIAKYVCTASFSTCSTAMCYGRDIFSLGDFHYNTLREPNLPSIEYWGSLLYDLKPLAWS